MAKITAKEISQNVASVLSGLSQNKQQLRSMITALRNRSDEIAAAERAKAEEHDRKELQDRFDAAKSAMNAASEEKKAAVQPEAEKTAAPAAEKPAQAAQPEEAPRPRPQAERPQRPAQDRPAPAARNVQGRPATPPAPGAPRGPYGRPVPGSQQQGQYMNRNGQGAPNRGANPQQGAYPRAAGQGQQGAYPVPQARASRALTAAAPIRRSSRASRAEPRSTARRVRTRQRPERAATRPGARPRPSSFPPGKRSA